MKNRKERWGKAKKSWYVRHGSNKKETNRYVQIEHKLSTSVSGVGVPYG